MLSILIFGFVALVWAGNAQAAGMMEVGIGKMETASLGEDQHVYFKYVV